jgi:hypothetical protein
MGAFAESIPTLGPTPQVLLGPGATDLRRSSEGLNELERRNSNADLLGDRVFALCNRGHTRLELLTHDGTGWWLCPLRPSIPFPVPANSRCSTHGAASGGRSRPSPPLRTTPQPIHAAAFRGSRRLMGRLRSVPCRHSIASALLRIACAPVVAFDRLLFVPTAYERVVAWGRCRGFGRADRFRPQVGGIRPLGADPTALIFRAWPAPGEIPGSTDRGEEGGLFVRAAQSWPGRGSDRRTEARCPRRAPAGGHGLRLR